ncbi:MAG TPA: nucleotidyltransferase domain-containing protein [Chitinophagaceae bacterium]|jgi:predicted nucleotidyltransferase|nr:nucleotidyltransferase domain-containing protein [Chitinophagaceae bacterium]
MEKEVKDILQKYFSGKPVQRAYLFGSAARNESSSLSDIDILVELDYKNGADYFVFFNMQNQLSELLRKKVDLVSANGLSALIKPVIDSEKVLIYERKAVG